jgi:hypothetical protein
LFSLWDLLKVRYEIFKNIDEPEQIMFQMVHAAWWAVSEDHDVNIYATYKTKLRK